MSRTHSPCLSLVSIMAPHNIGLIFGGKRAVQNCCSRLPIYWYMDRLNWTIRLFCCCNSSSFVLSSLICSWVSSLLLLLLLLLYLQFFVVSVSLSVFLAMSIWISSSLLLLLLLVRLRLFVLFILILFKD